MRPPIRVRDVDAADWDFVRRAWRDTFRLGGPAVQGSDKAHYHSEMDRLFAAIVPTAEARIACHPTDDDVRLGFVCYSGSTLLYAYVCGDRSKGLDFRGHGIVPAMLHAIPITAFAFATNLGVKRLKPLERGWKYLPRFTFGSRINDDT